jgi:hypothetical protein
MTLNRATPRKHGDGGPVRVQQRHEGLVDLACCRGAGVVGEVDCSGCVCEDFDGEAEGLGGRGGGNHAVVCHVANEGDRVHALFTQPGFEVGVGEDAGELLADALGCGALVGG